MLDLLARARERFAFSLSVFHVHHGLSPNADGWLAHCADVSSSLGLPFSSVQLNLAGLPGGNVEARARAGRYAAYASLAVDLVALAHHLDDQAETMLYRLVRGTGVHGAAGMPAARAMPEGGLIWRPLLDESRAALEDYAHARQLRWVEDESNAQDAYDRNYLRANVLPVLRSRFPGAAKALARAAGHFAEAGELLDELAAGDFGSVGERLSLARLASLSEARQRNLLRWLLARHGLRLEAQQLEVLRQQILTAESDRNPCFRLAAHALHRYRDELWVADHVEALSEVVSVDAVNRAIAPFHGDIVWQERASGLEVSSLDDMELRLRVGGEALRTHRGGPLRSVKNLFQEAGIPPWLRTRWPLLWRRGVLLAVPGIAVAAEMQAENGLWPRWIPLDWPDAP
ncbi:MAG: tRNA lysidine(34) synthetase TilS [Burkholderiales bacterium]|nr:tRNA lysidine(34) synthetase TilS [Burkholderiales bacterium]